MRVIQPSLLVEVQTTSDTLQFFTQAATRPTRERIAQINGGPITPGQEVLLATITVDVLYEKTAEIMRGLGIWPVNAETGGREIRMTPPARQALVELATSCLLAAQAYDDAL